MQLDHTASGQLLPHFLSGLVWPNREWRVQVSVGSPRAVGSNVVYTITCTWTLETLAPEDPMPVWKL